MNRIRKGMGRQPIVPAKPGTAIETLVCRNGSGRRGSKPACYLAVPAALREAIELKPGDVAEWLYNSDGTITLSFRKVGS